MRNLTKALTGTVVTIVGLVLLFQAWALYQSRERALELIETRAANRAQSTADKIDAVFSRLDAGLLAIRDHVVAEEVINGPTPNTKAREAEMRGLLRLWQKRMPKVERVHVVSADGRFVYSNIAPTPIQTVDDRPYFKEQAQAKDDRFRLSEMYFSRVGHNWSILVSRRLQTKSGSFAGVVMVTISAKSLQSEMTAIDQEQWFFAAFDKNRILVASNPMEVEWLGNDFPDNIIIEGLQQGRAHKRGLAFGLASARIWSACTVGALPLLMVAGYMEPLALAQWWHDLELNLLVAILLITGCAALLIVQRRNDAANQQINLLHERIQLATNSARLGIWEWDRGKDAVVCDETTSSLLQLPQGTNRHATKTWLASTFPEDKLHLQEVASRVGTVFLDERIRITTQTGEIRYLRLSGSVQADDADRTLRVIGVIRDATDGELAAHRLRSSEQYFRTLFDIVPHAVVVIEQGVVVDSNRPYREMFKITDNEPRPPWMLTPEHQAGGGKSPEAARRFYEGALSGSIQQTIWHCQRRNHEVFEAEIRATLFPHEGRQLVVATVRDLTEQRTMENMLHQAQKMDALGQLAGGVAHDFNNMLSAIMGSAELLSPELPVEKQQAMRNTIVTAAGRAAKLTSKLLAFARQGKYLSTLIDIHENISETITLLERTIDRRIILSTDLKATRSNVVGDPSQLQSALLNLGVNARDAMPSGGTLTISTQNAVLGQEQCTLGAFKVSPGEYVLISFTDTGVGIAPDIIKNVFDPFFTTKEVGKGTGLGLASVFGTMASHNGAVTVRSEIGKGSRFTLYLPITSQVPSSSQFGVEPLIRGGTGRVLVIDDEDLVRISIKLQLQVLGYQAIVLGEIEKAVETYATHQATLVAVLIDMVMPKLMGLDIARQLRAINPNVPIILMSGFPKTAHVEQWLGKTIDGFLQKPFNQMELGKMLSQLCGDR